MTRAVLMAVAVLAVGACSLCPDGYVERPSSGTYGFVQCVKETDQ